MSLQEKTKENNNIDVWSSIRNLKKKMRSSKNETEINSILQKSQNSTKLSSNSSMISHRELNISQVSHIEEIKEEQKKRLDETNKTQETHNFEDIRSNYNSREKTCFSNEDFIVKNNNTPSNNEEFEYPLENLNKAKVNEEEFNVLKHENEVLKQENKRLECVIASMIKENNKNFANFQKYHQQEYEEKINFYESEVKTLKEAFQKELESKDQDIEMLNAMIRNKSHSNPSNKINEKILIQNYENVINMLKNDFQNEVFELRNESQKHSNQLLEEKDVLERLLEEKQKELNKLKYFELYANTIPENKENISLNGNRQPQTSLRKNQNEKNIDNLLFKINKCMNENLLTESDFNLTSKNNTTSQIGLKSKRNDKNILMESGLTTDTMSKLVVAEEFPISESEGERENHGVYKETEGNLSIEQEDIFWMNYSIKDLNEKIRLAKK